MKRGEKLSTAVEVRSRTGDFFAQKFPFSQKDSIGDNFKDILLLFAGNDLESNKSVTAVVKPADNKAAKLNQDEQNEQQASDSNQGNNAGLPYEDCVSFMSIPVMQEVAASRSALYSQANVADIQAEPALTLGDPITAAQAKSNCVENNNAQKLSYDINHAENVLLPDAGAKKQISSIDRTDISQQKTILQKLPDAVKVGVNNVRAVGDSGPVISVSKAEENIKQEVIASRGVCHSQDDITNVQPEQKTVMQKPLGVPKAEIDNIWVSGGKSEPAVSLSKAEGTAKREVAAIRSTLHSHADITDFQFDSAVDKTTAGRVKSDCPDSDKAEKLSDQREARFKVNPDGTGVNNAVKVAEPVMGEYLPVNAVSKNLIGSKKPVSIPELPQEVSKLFEQAKANDQNKPIFLQLKLEPEQLGKLVIKLTYKKGEISAQFIASSLQAKEALENTMTQLKDALAKHQIILHEPVVSFGFSGEQAMPHNRQDFNGKKNNQGYYKSSGYMGEFEDEIEEVPGHNGVLIPGKGVDYII
ncbi:flagellar hook-length control protein [Desulfofarcimen acetoxidans DSM 771]|uniref:Flagellar hook-length control protein n=1 Tax=Desulfofarcimen acetoxidans (strain ATCC 49208 / DSM 771 / KCTC 5769 / VKM B-1644 / 5575) TaxID=485916 RepID=C8W1G2_DESAS|nr:flagellar hook-length control protein FliK [Desulfofarcimen acetoxidans]ACV61607.1 flagellar hook-length control protein [Desulfofarcimen acetoxidans DSM 771]